MVALSSTLSIRFVVIDKTDSPFLIERNNLSMLTSITTIYKYINIYRLFCFPLISWRGCVFLWPRTNACPQRNELSICVINPSISSNMMTFKSVNKIKLANECYSTIEPSQWGKSLNYVRMDHIMVHSYIIQRTLTSLRQFDVIHGNISFFKPTVPKVSRFKSFSEKRLLTWKSYQTSDWVCFWVD